MGNGADRPSKVVAREAGITAPLTWEASEIFIASVSARPLHAARETTTAPQTPLAAASSPSVLLRYLPEPGAPRRVPRRLQPGPAARVQRARPLDLAATRPALLLPAKPTQTLIIARRASEPGHQRRPLRRPFPCTDPTRLPLRVPRVFLPARLPVHPRPSRLPPALFPLAAWPRPPLLLLHPPSAVPASLLQLLQARQLSCSLCITAAAPQMADTTDLACC
jgi:hypothetical protein